MVLNLANFPTRIDWVRYDDFQEYLNLSQFVTWNNLTYSVVSWVLPNGLSLDSNTWIVSWVPTTLYWQNVTFWVNGVIYNPVFIKMW